MGLDSGNILVPGTGAVRVAPVGTTFPTTLTPEDLDGDYDAAFDDLGFITEEGVSLGRASQINQVRGWQSFYVLRYIKTQEDLTLAFALLEWKAETIKFYFGGGTIDTFTDGTVFTPPDPSVVDEKALAVDWVDGDVNYRLLIPKGLVTETQDVQLARQNPASLGVTFGITPASATDVFEIQTNSSAVPADS